MVTVVNQRYLHTNTVPSPTPQTDKSLPSSWQSALSRSWYGLYFLSESRFSACRWRFSRYIFRFSSSAFRPVRPTGSAKSIRIRPKGGSSWLSPLLSRCRCSLNWAAFPKGLGDTFRGGFTFQSLGIRIVGTCRLYRHQHETVSLFRNRLNNNHAQRPDVKSAYTVYILHPFFVVIATYMARNWPVPYLVSFLLIPGNYGMFHCRSFHPASPASRPYAIIVALV